MSYVSCMKIGYTTADFIKYVAGLFLLKAAMVNNIFQEISIVSHFLHKEAVSLCAPYVVCSQNIFVMKSENNTSLTNKKPCTCFRRVFSFLHYFNSNL